MQSDYYINLHFNQAIAQKTGYTFKIGDKGCKFHLHCEDLDPSGMYAHIVFNHQNNTCVEGIPTGSGKDYEYTIAGNEFGVCGKTVVDLKFYDSNLSATQRISTASFIIEIIPDTLTPFDEESSSYADSLERAREEIDAAIIELQGAERDLDDMSDQFADTLQDYIDAFGNTGPINPRGTYDDDTPYVPRDAVAYTAGGKTLTYINKQACTGIAPTDPDEGAAHWQIMIDVAVGGAFSALEDVSIDPQTLTDGQVPVYNDTDDVWENKTILENSLTSTATDKALTAAKGKELQDNKQPKELETAITIAGTSETTVETALGALNTHVDNNLDAILDFYSSKNINGYPYDETTKSSNGLTFTDNGDGTITVSGTAGADTQFICHNVNLKVLNGTYKLLGCPSGGSYNNGFSVYTNWWQSVGVVSTTYIDEGTGATVEINGSQDSADYANITIAILVKNGTVISTPITFKPMIIDSRIENESFAPFAMTNKQLTDTIKEEDLSAQLTVNTTYFDTSLFVEYKKKCNGLKWLNIYGQPITTVPHDTALISGFTPSAIHKVCPVYSMASQTTRFVRVWIDGYGQLMIDDNLANTDIFIYNDIIR